MSRFLDIQQFYIIRKYLGIFLTGKNAWQGDSLSRHLYIAAVTQGIGILEAVRIGLEEFKMAQHADDLTVSEPNLEPAQFVFRLLENFATCSGLKINYTKTVAMWIDSCRKKQHLLG